MSDGGYTLDLALEVAADLEEGGDPAVVLGRAAPFLEVLRPRRVLQLADSPTCYDALLRAHVRAFRAAVGDDLVDDGFWTVILAAQARASARMYADLEEVWRSCFPDELRAFPLRAEAHAGMTWVQLGRGDPPALRDGEPGATLSGQ